MYYLSTIKYPVDPNNRSYLPSRSRWIFHYARQIQLAIANGAAPAVSLTIRNLDSRLSRSIVPQDLDPDIPAFQTNENGVIENTLIMLHMNLWTQVETLLYRQRKFTTTTLCQTIG